MKSIGRTPFAKKSLGQNFLTDPHYIQRIIEAVAPEPEDVICEIGPGRGALTEMLVATGATIIAVELDSGLAQTLRERFDPGDRFYLIEDDVLVIDFRELKLGAKPSWDSRLKLVANLPYYISTAILQRVAQQRGEFSELVLMFQNEVADRITAEPGNSDRGFLTVIVEAGFEVEKLFEVPPTAFRPVPKVQSAVVRLTPKPTSSFDDEAFRDLVSVAFAHKRKTIENNLKTKYSCAVKALQNAGIGGMRRAEALTLTEWSELYRSLHELSA